MVIFVLAFLLKLSKLPNNVITLVLFLLLYLVDNKYVIFLYEYYLFIDGWSIPSANASYHNGYIISWISSLIK